MNATNTSQCVHCMAPTIRRDQRLHALKNLAPAEEREEEQLYPGRETMSSVKKNLLAVYPTDRNTGRAGGSSTV